MTRGYKERALSALKWSVAGQIALQAIRFAFGIALARLLSPREFGFIAMLTVLTQFVTSISDLGFEDALIQKRDLDETDRSSVFWAVLVGGITLTAGLVAGAPWIAAFYGVEELTPLASVLSALFVLDAFGTVPRALVARHLEFRLRTGLRCAAVTVAGVCAVTLAWRGYGVMSLAAELLVVAGLESVLLFSACAWRPRLAFRVAALRDLLGFSANRVAARTLGYWARHVDQLLVGKFLGVGPLGLYVRAFNFTRFPVVVVSRAIAQVMFPSLALIRDDTERVRRVYVRTTGAVALATFPMCMGLFATAEPLVVGVLGPQWREAVPLLRILSIAGLVQSISTLAGGLYLSQGRADLQLRLTGLQNLSTIAAVVLGLHWGVLGAATAYALATVLNAVPTLYFAGRMVDLRPTVVLAYSAPVFLAAAAMTAVVLGVDAWARLRLESLELLGVEIVTGVVVYWGGLRLFRVGAYLDVVDVLRQPSSQTEGS